MNDYKLLDEWVCFGCRNKFKRLGNFLDDKIFYKHFKLFNRKQIILNKIKNL